MTTRKLPLESLLGGAQRHHRDHVEPIADVVIPRYRDTGCGEGGPSCLRCRLPACVHDIVHASAQRDASYHRHRAIRALSARDPALNRHQLAAYFGCSQRTISRAFQIQEEAA